MTRTPKLFTAGMMLAASLAGTAYAAEPSAAVTSEAGPALQGPDAYSFMVGAVKVTALSDGSVPQDLHVLLRHTSPEATDALLKDSFLSNPVEASINAFLFRDADKLVLVDTGSGDFFGPGAGGKLLSSLAAIAISPESITDVLLTHAHDDHMGGLVHGAKLNFPNAIVHLAKADLDFFMDPESSRRTGYALSYFEQAAAALGPEVKAGKIRAFSTDGEILPGVSAEQHPGHTPGTAFYRLKSHGQEIVFTGDVIHVAAVQATHPEVTITYDVDPVKAAAVRNQALAQFARQRTLLAVPHLPFPGVGHFRKQGAGFEWVPVPYGNRDAGRAEAPADPRKNGDQ